MDKAALLKEQKPFDGKKNCWIPDEKDGFAPAEIVSSTGMWITSGQYSLCDGPDVTFSYT